MLCDLYASPRRLAPRPNRLRLAALSASAVVSFNASGAALANTGSAWLDPSDIDRAVTAFTGAPIGDVGGARAPADRRLRLAACAQALNTSWHGQRGTAVRVECASTRDGSQPWKIFVATRPAQAALSPSSAAQSRNQAPIIKRGDPITVVVRGRGFSVQQTGEALENGRIGDWIGVRTQRGAEPIRARIERPGMALIPAG